MEEVTSYHPLLEWNRLRGCRAGIEYDFRDSVDPVACLEAAREWGRWAQVNYEEYNGVGLDRHLRALRVCYAFGARFYTFYNWQRIEPNDRWAGYVGDFCKDGPKALALDRPADASQSFAMSSSHAFTADVPTSWATVNEVCLTVDAPGEYTLTAYDSAGRERVLGFRRKLVSEAGSVCFDLPNCIPTNTCRRPYCLVTRGDGKEFGLLSDSSGEPAVSLYSDSRRERMQSLVICWRADAEALISELKGRHLPGLETAERLLRSGDYRRAYEEAVRLEASSPRD
jgi:hypothetical protein